MRLQLRASLVTTKVLGTTVLHVVPAHSPGSTTHKTPPAGSSNDPCLGGIKSNGLVSLTLEPESPESPAASTQPSCVRGWQRLAWKRLPGWAGLRPFWPIPSRTSGCTCSPSCALESQPLTSLPPSPGVFLAPALSLKHLPPPSPVLEAASPRALGGVWGPATQLTGCRVPLDLTSRWKELPGKLSVLLGDLFLPSLRITVSGAQVTSAE